MYAYEAVLREMSESNVNVERGEESVLIPCELCEELVHLHEFEHHMNICTIQFNMLRQIMIMEYYRASISNPEDDEYHMNLRIADALGDVVISVDDIDRAAPLCKATDKTEADVMCAICQEEFDKETKETSHRPLRMTTCKHTFCAECIERWLSRSRRCPVCMRDC